MTATLNDALGKLGVPEDAVVAFDSGQSARHLKYLDLLHPSLSNNQATTDGYPNIFPDGVIESSGKPAIYVIRQESLGPRSRNSEAIADLTRTLACRADAQYLAVIEPGRTSVYRIGFYATGTAIESFVIADHSLALRNLLNGITPEEQEATQAAQRQWLDDLLFELLTKAAHRLRGACSANILSDGAVLSLIGRALFIRFLADREIIRDAEVSTIVKTAKKVEHLFNSPEAMVSTFVWLDETFNGDLLDLGTRDYTSLFQRLGNAALEASQVLSNVIYRAVDQQLSLDWGGLRFRHIPVDVLSQVYEHFAHRYMPDLVRDTSVHYTPRHIAELVVDGTFSATQSAPLSSVRVLDPAVGAGVFLVLAFRRIIGELWQITGRRPNRKKIRYVLNNQLCGLDINPESIKVAALSLYLAALELDPDPQPISDLKFEKLFGTVLRCVSKQKLAQGADAHLGSLSSNCPDIGTFDVVFGNPPWTALGLKDKPYLDNLAQKVIKQRFAESSLHNGNLVPDQWPDLAFLWQSMQWCRPGGAIGLLVHARLLFSYKASVARSQIFRALKITGILNGTALRLATNIWPSTKAPFCAIVAVNETPDQDDNFYYLAPRLEQSLKAHGEFRLDPRSAMSVPISLIGTNSCALKILFCGSSFDLELVDRLKRHPRMKLGNYINHVGMELFQGFIQGNKTKKSDLFAKLPVLNASDRPTFVVNCRVLPNFEQRYSELMLERPRPLQIYRGPLLLFRKAPKLERAQRGAVLCFEDIVYSQQFYGMHASGAQCRAIAMYLYVLSYSDLLVYWSLMTSSQFGIGHDTYNLDDVLHLPIVPYEDLSEDLRNEVDSIASEIANNLQPWERLENFVAKIYRLSCEDLNLIADALNFELPYSKVRAYGEQPLGIRCNGVPSEFLTEIDRILRSVLGKYSGPLHVSQMELQNIDGWAFFRITQGSFAPEIDHRIVSKLVSEVSEPFMTSQLRIQLGPNDWILGQLARRRYWSASRARQITLSLIEEGAFLRRVDAA